ncbi:unnamed protein product [Closterium sp. NIES-53]
MEEAERDCVATGITDIRFVCSITLHCYIRADDFRHICGGYLYGKYYPQQMGNFNAVDMDETVDIGVTRHGEAVQINRHYAEADLVVYANVNYVSMAAGTIPLLLYFVFLSPHPLLIPPLPHLSLSFSLPACTNQLLPLWLCVKVLWFMRGPFGLLQVTAGETQAVHERTLAAIYRDKVMDIDGQADILILAPSALGSYTKDTYLNPLLVNTYALGYYYNMYVDDVPLLKEGGCVIVEHDMQYEWSSPAHDAYRRLFEEVLAVAPGLDEFERFQQQFVHDKRLNDIYRRGLGPAAVHGIYMYTWAAHGMDKVLAVAPGLDEFERYQQQFVQDEHLNDIYRQGLGPAAVHRFYMYMWAAHGMDKVGKVYVVGAKDPRGPAVLCWEMADTTQDAVDQAQVFLGNSKAAVTYLRCPPVGYVRVHTEGQGEGSAAEQAQGEVLQAVSKHQ